MYGRGGKVWLALDCRHPYVLGSPFTEFINIGLMYDHRCHITWETILLIVCVPSAKYLWPALACVYDILAQIFAFESCCCSQVKLIPCKCSCMVYTVCPVLYWFPVFRFLVGSLPPSMLKMCQSQFYCLEPYTPVLRLPRREHETSGGVEDKLQPL